MTWWLIPWGGKGCRWLPLSARKQGKGERGDNSEGNIGFGGVLSSGRGGVTNGKRGSEHVCASPACTAYLVFHIWKCNYFSECDRAGEWPGQHSQFLRCFVFVLLYLFVVVYSYFCESGGSHLYLFFVFSYSCESGGSHLCLSPASATGLTTTCWSTIHPAQPFFWNISNIDLEENNIWNIDQQSTYWSTTLLAQPFFSINTNIDLKYSRYLTTFKIHLVCWSTFIFKYSKHQ